MYKRLKEFRESLGLTQEEFGKSIGVAKSTYNNYETGIREPKSDFWISIAQKYDVTVDYLMGYSDRPEKKPPPHSAEAHRLADAYDNHLDSWGRQAVRELVETEVERCRDEAQLRESPLKEEPKVIPLYWSPAAAGLAAPILGQEYDLYELKPEDPQGAVFSVKVDGDSMEPYFPDGSIAFCNKDPIADGDVGVFCLDGESFIKQYLYDPVLRMTYLFSLNRKRADADKLITSTSGQTLTCMGRVMTRKRFPLPGRG